MLSANKSNCGSYKSGYDNKTGFKSEEYRRCATSPELSGFIKSMLVLQQGFFFYGESIKKILGSQKIWISTLKIILNDFTYCAINYFKQFSFYSLFRFRCFILHRYRYPRAMLLNTRWNVMQVRWEITQLSPRDQMIDQTQSDL